MATSKIGTGLRLVKIPNSSFSWNSSNRFFSANKAHVDSATGLNTVITYIVFSPNAGGAIWGAGTSSTGNSLIIAGWLTKTGEFAPESYQDYFDCYAIGY